MKIKNIVCTCGACPSQWEAKTLDNRPVYIRYRWGYLGVGIGEPGDDIMGAVRKEMHDPDVCVQLGDDFSGVISLDKVMPYIEALPEPKDVTPCP